MGLYPMCAVRVVTQGGLHNTHAIHACRSDGDSDYEDSRIGKQIPSWAHAEEVGRAMEIQMGEKKDEIDRLFGMGKMYCNIQRVFGAQGGF